MDSGVMAKRSFGLLGALMLLFASVGTSVEASAQGPGSAGPLLQESPNLAFLASSPWVEANGTWFVQLNPEAIPQDGSISYTIREPLKGDVPAMRAQLKLQADGKQLGRQLQRPVTAPIAELRQPDGSVRIQVPIRSATGTGEGVLIPNSGSHPVTIKASTASGSVLAETTVYLNRLPDKDATAPLRLGILAVSTQGTPSAADGVDGLDDATLADLSRVGSYAEFARDQHLSYQIQPSLLERLAAQAKPAPESADDAGSVAAGATLTKLQQSVATNTVVSTPWAPLDLEAWADTGAPESATFAFAEGGLSTRQILQQPWTDSTLGFESTLGPKSVGLLQTLNIGKVVVVSGQLSDQVPPKATTGWNRPFTVVGNANSTVRAFQVDPDLQALLDLADGPSAQTVHQLLTTLFATWIGSDQPLGALVTLTDRTNPATAQAFLEALASLNTKGSPLTTVGVDDLFDQLEVQTKVPNKPDLVARTLMTPDTIADVGELSGMSANTERALAGYVSMVGAADPKAAELRRSILQSLDRTVPLESQLSLGRSSLITIGEELDQITMSPSRGLRVTAQRTEIPVRIANGLQRPVTVQLRFDSPRLTFIRGSRQTVTLQPGENLLSIDVLVRASGQFNMTVEATTPAAGIVLASSKLSIRSTTFSGVGLLISGGALVFLVIWWTRTLRRRDAQQGEPPT
jgi:hypothetical protein